MWCTRVIHCTQHIHNHAHAHAPTCAPYQVLARLACVPVVVVELPNLGPSPALVLMVRMSVPCAQLLTVGNVHASELTHGAMLTLLVRAVSKLRFAQSLLIDDVLTQAHTQYKARLRAYALRDIL